MKEGRSRRIVCCSGKVIVMKHANYSRFARPRSGDPLSATTPTAAPSRIAAPPRTLLLLLCFMAGGILPALAQTAASSNFQTTNKSVDFGGRGDSKVNPSTLGMEIQIPLGNYMGRAGLSLPVTLNYSSALWRINYNYYYPGTYTYNGNTLGNGFTSVVARYAEHSASGWTSSLGFPFLDAAPPQECDINGVPKPPDVNSCGTSGCYVVDRQIIWMPDGSSHEFRSTDQPKAVSDTTPFPDDMYAVDGSRMRYQKSTQTLFMPDGSRYLLGSNQYVDRNGNTLTYDSANSRWLDTLGRAIPLPPAGVPGTNMQPLMSPGTYTYSLPGVNGSTVTYTFVWKHLGDAGVLTTSQPLQYTADSGCNGSGPYSPNLFQSDPFTTHTCIQNADSVFNPVVLYQIILPDQQAYTFTYDIYGEIDKVQLPTGGYERYQYQPGVIVSSAQAPYSQTSRHVVNRYVSASGTGSDEAQWQYGGGGGSVTITAPDNSQVQRSMYVDSTADGWGYSPDGARAGLAYDERTYSAPDGGGVRHMLRRTLTEWAMTGSNAVGLLDVSKATRNARVTKQVELLLDTGGGSALAKTTTCGYDTTYQFDVGVDQTSRSEYDFAAVDQNTAQTGDIGSMPTGALLRRTLTSYLTGNASYRARNIVGLPASVTMQNASGGTVAQTVMSYDESAYQLANTYGMGAVTQWSDPGSVRGNLTTTSRWLDSTNTWLSTHSQYDQAGSVVSIWDANGNQTQVAYSSTYAYAYPTSGTSPVPDPTGQYGSTTSLTSATTYDFSTGLVTSTIDANGQTTTYQYNDPLDRLTQVSYPDGGQTTYNHVGHHQCGAYVETRTLLDSSGRQTDSWQFLDGLGRPYLSETYENQDPNNPYLRADTQYDVMGRAYKVSTAFRSQGCTSDPNPTGWMQTTFDALSRPTQVKTTADGATVTTSYSGNTVTVTDQAGKQRSSVSDALGRLTQVVEDPTAGGLNYSTTYTYDVLGNLRQVTQGSQQRFFMYDSLSRLVRAKNPEQAAGSVASNLTDPVTGNTQWSMAYGYDSDGNLMARVDARNVTTTYGYDALNRNTTVRYTDGTKDIDRHYDGAINGKGRFYYFNWDAANNSRFDTHLAIDGYDAMGRALNYRQCFLTNGVASADFTAAYTYDKAGHVLTETYPSSHVVSYNYDIAGRLGDNAGQPAFSGNLGDRVQRTYSSSLLYDPTGGTNQERFGTDTPVFNKHFYNSRGQLNEIRVSTYAFTDAAHQTDWNRGAILNVYSAAPADGWTASGPDNNGNLRKQMIYLPNDDAVTGYAQLVDNFGYDSLNRLSWYDDKYNNATPISHQAYQYDRWGNRTIDAGNTTNAPAPQFTVDAANRLGVPAGQAGAMAYDAAGNLTNDTYQGGQGGGGTRAYDAENRMTAAQMNASQSSAYTYDANGRRVKRNTGGGEVWQIYGMGGELLAEYGAGASPSQPQEEYGYRGGELLVMATVTGGWGAAPVIHDNPLVVGQTVVQSRHVTELRDAINSLRSHLGLAAYSWQADASVGATIKADPILEMRTALDQALGAPGGGYAPGLAQGQLVKAVHIQELRDRVLAAWQGGTGVDLRWLVADQIGTPRMVIDKTGSLSGVRRHDYLPFGEETPADGSWRNAAHGYGAGDGVRQKFTGKERDNETGLDFFGARSYSNAQGRFTSVDSLRASARTVNPQSLNRYSYVLNRPTIAIDPDGLSTIIVTVKASTDGSGRPTATVEFYRGNGPDAGTRRGGPYEGLAAGQHRGRMTKDGDTPFGVYKALTNPTQGGKASSRLGDGYGTGKVFFEGVSGEIIDSKRSLIRIHGGGTGLPDSYAMTQELIPTNGCVRLLNMDVNDLVKDINELGESGDPLDRVFIGDADYLNNLAEQKDASGNYLYPDLRLGLGLYQTPAEMVALNILDQARRLNELILHQIEEEQKKAKRQRPRNY